MGEKKWERNAIKGDQRAVDAFLRGRLWRILCVVDCSCFSIVQVVFNEHVLLLQPKGGYSLKTAKISSPLFSGEKISSSGTK